MDNVNAIQNEINIYFSNESILYEALIHSSYSHEQKLSINNERLEFLGDAVLEIIISDYLFFEHINLPEGDLTRRRAEIVCETTLAAAARKINLGDYLFLSKGEERSAGRKKPSILADAFEAVIGAVYIDQGIATARVFCLPLLLAAALGEKPFTDYKSMLQELIQKDGVSTVTYEICSERGPDHNKHFGANAISNGVIIGFGVGKTKKAAEQKAAENALSIDAV